MSTTARARALSNDFPFEWHEPSDAELSWEWDDMHTPFALAPLAGDYIGLISAGYNWRFRRLDLPKLFLSRVWNGFAYFTMHFDVPETEIPGILDRAREGSRGLSLETDAYWREEAMPELLAIYGWLASYPVEDATGAELASAWDEAWRRIGRAWEIHFYAIAGPYQALDDLADLYESVVDARSPGEALRLVQGGVEVLHDVQRTLVRLADMAASHAVLAARLAETDPTTLEEVRALDGAAEFVAELEAFLERHGHLGQGFDDLALASWAEEPSMLLAELRVRLGRPPVDGAARHARLAAEAEALADQVRARLADRPDDLERFERTLALARLIGPLTEGHNYWIDRMAQARLRRFAVRVGGRLVEAGVVEAAEDILYLHRAEIPLLLAHPEDRRGLVARRRTEHAHWRGLRPPQNLGRPPAPGGPPGRFDQERVSSVDPHRLKGIGASAGVVRGTARIVLVPADFARVQSGEVIVCPSSNPSWVPLFAIAGGLVTDTGGVLSHAAVVAREFGLPAVVGTSEATTRIVDGSVIELDGTTGEVRLL